MARTIYSPKERKCSSLCWFFPISSCFCGYIKMTAAGFVIENESDISLAIVWVCCWIYRYFALLLHWTRPLFSSHIELIHLWFVFLLCEATRDHVIYSFKCSWRSIQIAFIVSWHSHRHFLIFYDYFGRRGVPLGPSKPLFTFFILPPPTTHSLNWIRRRQRRRCPSPSKESRKTFWNAQDFLEWVDAC